MATVVLLGTLDTTGEEHRWLLAQLEAAGCSAVTADVRSFTVVSRTYIGPGGVAGRSGDDVGPLLAARDCCAHEQTNPHKDADGVGCAEGCSRARTNR